MVEKLREKIQPIPDGSYVLGLSGGADSVALLMILLPDIREGRIKLKAVHVNHGIRGKEADKDERFCSELCQRERIPFQAFYAELAGKTDEASARAARFTFFRMIMTESSADALLLAHNADDQAETFLMRLLRGAGPEGLGCMKTDETNRGIRIIRPMLHLKRKEIRNALDADGIRWCEDSTNQNPVYLRNRIRMELIPVLEQFTASAVDKIDVAAGLIAEDNEVLVNQSRIFLDEYAKGRLLDAQMLAVEPAAIQKRVLRLWWRMNAPDLQEHALSNHQTEELTVLLHCTKGKMNLPGDMYAVRAGRYLVIEGLSETQSEPVPVSGPETTFGNYSLTISPSAGNPGDGRITQEIPEDYMKGCEIRTRQPGDRIWPFGSTGSRKLQDYLTDRKIPGPFRDTIPLLCREGEILMVCGVGTGNIPRWESIQHPVRLTWSGYMPWITD